MSDADRPKSEEQPQRDTAAEIRSFQHRVREHGHLNPAEIMAFLDALAEHVLGGTVKDAGSAY